MLDTNSFHTAKHQLEINERLYWKIRGVGKRHTDDVVNITNENVEEWEEFVESVDKLKVDCDELRRMIEGKPQETYIPQEPSAYEMSRVVSWFGTREVDVPGL